MEEQLDTEGDVLLDIDGDLPSGDEIASELERYLRGESA
jgi:hypothetical protein